MPDPQAEETLLALLQIANLLVRRMGPLFQRVGITPQQWTVLSVLASLDEPPTLAGVARALRVSKQNVTGMIARLEALGVVERTSDATDLRASRLSLTRRGRQIHDRIAPRYRDWIEQALEPLTAAERNTLHRALARLVAGDPGELRSSE